MSDLQYERDIKWGICPICKKQELKPHTELCGCWHFVDGRIVKRDNKFIDENINQDK